MGIIGVWAEFHAARYYIEDAIKTAEPTTKANLQLALGALKTFEQYIEK